jgi:hypothetical protein
MLKERHMAFLIHPTTLAELSHREMIQLTYICITKDTSRHLHLQNRNTTQYRSDCDKWLLALLKRYLAASRRANFANVQGTRLPVVRAAMKEPLEVLNTTANRDHKLQEIRRDPYKRHRAWALYTTGLEVGLCIRRTLGTFGPSRWATGSRVAIPPTTGTRINSDCKTRMEMS